MSARQKHAAFAPVFVEEIGGIGRDISPHVIELVLAAREADSEIMNRDAAERLREALKRFEGVS